LTNTKIRLVVIDDHPLFREGVVRIVSACADIEVVAQGASAKEALEVVRCRDPDIVILDINIPGGGMAALDAMIAVSVRRRMAGDQDNTAAVGALYGVGKQCSVPCDAKYRLDQPLREFQL
jgi:DNA-binding NarL/FixJ family response regulator